MHGFIQDWRNDNFASVSSLPSSSDDDELNFENHLGKLEKSKVQSLGISGALQYFGCNYILGAIADSEILLFPA